MQVSSKLLFKTAVVGLALVLMLGLYMALGSTTKDAGAVTNPPQWNILRGYVDSFFTGQYVADAVNGESGFTINRSTLKSRIDSNGDMSPNSTNITTTVTGVLGEGDDAANAPVLLDNIVGNAQVIPGTSVRCDWNAGYSSTTADNCFNSAKVTDIKNRVNAHAAAGFSTDIVVYCVSGRTESVVSGGMGTLAQTGALGDSDLNTAGDQAPKVLAYKWGRNGWNSTTTTTTSTTGTTGTVSAPSTTYGDGTGSGSICSGAPNDAELVRCTAQWAIYNGTGNTANWLTPSATANGAGYNISNGVTTLTSSNQVIDIRTPSMVTTPAVTGGPTTLQIPINTLFGSGVNFMNTRTTSTKNVFVGRTTHVAGMAAINAVMLGYHSSFLAHGVNAWNTSLGGESYQTSVAGSIDTPAYPFQTATASSEWSGVDTTAPTITVAPSAGTITDTSAVVSRTANEPATMKVEYGTSTGVYASTANNTVLNASKSVSLTGLSPYTTYYVKVTSYDGQANGTVSSEISFQTADSTAPSITNLAPTGTIYTGSTTISADYSDATSGIDSSTAKIFLDGSATALTGCTATATAISCPATGLAYGAHTFSVEVKDNVANTATNTGGSFTVGDNVAPAVTYSGPTGTITTTGTTITGTYTDAAPSSGVDTTSATVSIDAGAPTACTAAAGSISCSVAGLSQGAHSAVISISDNDANTGSSSTGSGSFYVCTEGQPPLTLATHYAYWASMADYTNGDLSVVFKLTAGAINAYNVAITGSANTNGVTLLTATPASVGNIAATTTSSITLKYDIPTGVTQFNAALTGTGDNQCGIVYTYP